MRCLRSIGDIQETGHIYLSQANGEILEAELQQNFRVTREELERKNTESEIVVVEVSAVPPPVILKLVERTLYESKRRDKPEELERKNTESETVVVEVSAVPPPVILKLVRERTLYESKRRDKPEHVDFGLTDERVHQYRVTVATHRALSEAPIHSREITSELSQREYSRYTLTAELARYFQFDGLSPFAIEEAINTSKDGAEHVIWAANLNNRIVYEILVPALFKAMFKIESFSKTEIFLCLVFPLYPSGLRLTEDSHRYRCIRGILAAPPVAFVRVAPLALASPAMLCTCSFRS
jgi:type III restriction enzyme